MAGCVFFNDAKSKLKLTATLFRNNTNIGFNVGKHTEVVPDTWSHEFLTLRPPKNVVKDFFPVLETITISVPTKRIVGTLRSISTCDFKEVLNYLYSPKLGDNCTYFYLSLFILYTPCSFLLIFIEINLKEFQSNFLYKLWMQSLEILWMSLFLCLTLNFFMFWIW